MIICAYEYRVYINIVLYIDCNISVWRVNAFLCPHDLYVNTVIDILRQGIL
jgi:hypothetical protein